MCSHSVSLPAGGVVCSITLIVIDCSGIVCSESDCAKVLKYVCPKETVAVLFAATPSFTLNVRVYTFVSISETVGAIPISEISPAVPILISTKIVSSVRNAFTNSNFSVSYVYVVSIPLIPSGDFTFTTTSKVSPALISVLLACNVTDDVVAP